MTPPTQGRLILITGPTRSGKSRCGERLAERLSRDMSVAYVATAEVRDDEMAARVASHQARRPAGWQTIEEPLRLAQAVRDAAAAHQVVLVESLDSWVSNRLLQADPVAGPEATQLDRQKVEALECELLAEIDSLLAARARSHLIVVSVEAGWGLVPPYPLGRAFRDLLGRANEAVAAAADEVYLVVAGLAVNLKHLSGLGGLSGLIRRDHTEGNSR
jgi:adenosylcobinamide kinase/adenosylcobinamide-phosphate guanylyltransferase